MTDDQDYPVVAAIVRVGDYVREVRCNRGLTRQEANFVFVLGEHVSRLMPLDDVCHRMKIGHSTLRVYASNIRKILHYDWIINIVSGRGIRLCYLGSPLSEADLLEVFMSPVVHGRVGLKIDLATRRKIRDTQIRNESWRNFHRRTAV